MLRIELKECQEYRPGYAYFTARKWNGESAVEIAVQRNQDSHYFAGGKEWSIEPVWHKTTELQVEGDTLQGTIGPWLIDGLLSQSGNVRFLMQVRDGSVEDRGPVALSGNILASSAVGDSSREMDIRQAEMPVEPPAAPISAEPIVEPSIENVVEEQVEETIEEVAIPQTETPVSETKKSKTGLIIAIVLLLLAIAAGAYFFLAGKSESNENVSECSVSNSSDELTFIQTCLKTKPSTQRILEIVAEAKQQNKCNIAQRLYAHQAQSGNVEIALAYAKEYEVGSSCFNLDKDNAIYWYETALGIDPENKTAKERLADLKK